MARRRRRRAGSCPKGSRYYVKKGSGRKHCARTKASAIKIRKRLGKGARIHKR